VTPILEMARIEAGGAANPIALYRDAGWRERKAQTRKPVGLGAGIV
jgi:L-rhamnose isomerase/sugar isomerase